VKKKRKKRILLGIRVLLAHDSGVQFDLERSWEGRRKDAPDAIGVEFQWLANSLHELVRHLDDGGARVANC